MGRAAVFRRKTTYNTSFHRAVVTWMKEVVLYWGVGWLFNAVVKYVSRLFLVFFCCVGSYIRVVISLVSKSHQEHDII